MEEGLPKSHTLGMARVWEDLIHLPMMKKMKRSLIFAFAANAATALTCARLAASTSIVAFAALFQQLAKVFGSRTRFDLAYYVLVERQLQEKHPLAQLQDFSPFLL